MCLTFVYISDKLHPELQELSLLLENRTFVDYFNIFLCLPVSIKPLRIILVFCKHGERHDVSTVNVWFR